MPNNAGGPSLSLSVTTDDADPRVLRGVAEIAAVRARRGWEQADPVHADVSIVLRVDGRPGEGPGLPLSAADRCDREAYSIERSSSSGNRVAITVGAGDQAGAMYGAFELAEQLETIDPSGIESVSCRPAQAQRGVKLNIPLDVRTPSYADWSLAAQENIETYWEIGFWKETIDELARMRYNLVSLWNLHPFPSMVRVPEYPEVALDDVRRSTAPLDQLVNHRRLADPAITDAYETVRSMPMDAKIAFWREVFAYGRSRNVRFYLVTWNAYVNGTAGKHGISSDPFDTVTVDYTRASVAAMLRTYPDLAGIGVTAGEHMDGISVPDRERWVFETYGRAVLQVADEQPGRAIDFVHRQHDSDTELIRTLFAPLADRANVNFVFSFKYAKAHIFSAVRQPFHRDFVESLAGGSTLWTLRNDDTYFFRSAQPEFVAGVVRGLPESISEGFYIGSDNYTWARDQLSATGRRENDFIRHWLQWTLWGRLGFDPDLSRERIVDLCGRRLGYPDPEPFLRAWEAASGVFPLVTGFHFGPLDFQWYPEFCLGHRGYARTPSGFHDVNSFIDVPPHPEAGCRSIGEFVAGGDSVGKRTPYEVAEALDAGAQIALEGIEAIPADGNEMLFDTVHDIRVLAELGRYYASKIRGATELARFRAAGDLAARDAAIEALHVAAWHCRAYASLALVAYASPVMTGRVGIVDFRTMAHDAVYDVMIAGGSPTVGDFGHRGAGTVYGAEDAIIVGLERGDDECAAGSWAEGTNEVPRRSIAWDVTCDRNGVHEVELRYSLRAPFPTTSEAAVSIDGREVGALALWHTGYEYHWACDAVRLPVDPGDHRIEFALPPAARIRSLQVRPGPGAHQ